MREIKKKHGRKKSILAIVLSLVMICMFLVPAYANEQEEAEKKQVQEMKIGEETPVPDEISKLPAQALSDGSDQGETDTTSIPEMANPATPESEEDPQKSPEPDKKPDREDLSEKAYPAVTLHKSAGGVAVTLTAPEGSLPKGVDLHVARVTNEDVFEAVDQKLAAQGRTLTDAVAIDVTPVDANGRELQPKKPVTVSFSGTGLDVESGGYVGVYRVSDDASSVTQMSASVATANSQQFSTDHFTIYVSGGSTSDPNGDGSGPNTTSNRKVLEYGDSVELLSDHADSGVFGTWELSAGDRYASLSGHTVTNTNSSSSDQNVTVHHRYRTSIIPLRYSDEYFYIRVRPEKFTVTYMLQDAGQSGIFKIKEEKIYKSTVISTTEPTDLPETKEEGGVTYKLYKWYTDDDWAEKAELDVPISEDVTVYARYAGEAKIHYVKNTTSAATVPADQYDGIGNKVTIGTASRSGFALEKWTTEAEGGDSYMPGDVIDMPAEGMTLYAQWAQDRVSMHYFYNYPGRDNDQFRSVTNIYKNYHVNLVSDYPERRGFIFLGWSEDRDEDPMYYPGATFATDDRNAINLYAQWGSYSEDDLVYDSLTAKGEERIYDGTGYTISGVAEGESARHPGFVRVGATPGWPSRDVYADIRDIRAAGTDAGSYATPVTAQLYHETLGVLTPVWTLLGGNEYIPVTDNILKIKPVEYTVTMDSAKAPFSGDTLTAGGTVAFGDGSVTFPAEGAAVTLVNGETLNMRATGEQTEVGSSRNAYEADWGKPEWGETTSTAKSYNYFLTEAVAGKLTVYYPVNFDENTEEPVQGMPDPAEAVKDAGEDFPKAVIPDNKPVRKRNTFHGWAIDPEAGKADYQPGDELTVTEDMLKDDAVTLYAVWSVNRYTVRYDGNGATNGSMKDEEFTCDKEKALSANSYEKTGHTFKGWSLSKKDADDGTVSYQDEESVFNLTEKEGAVVTLYAVWEANEYKLTFDPCGGTWDGSSDPLEIEFTYGKTITIPKAPKRKGYTFLYWKGSKYYPGDQYEVKGDHVFKAKWGKDSHAKKTKTKDGVSTGDYLRMSFCIALLALGTVLVLAILRRKGSRV